MIEAVVPAAPRFMARLAAAFYMLESGASVFGQLAIPGRLVVRGDAAATASNILANEPVFRLAIAAALLAVAFHIVDAVLFYYLLKPVSRSFSLLAAFFLLAASGIQAFAGLLQVGAVVALTGGHSFSAFSVEQLQAIALMLLNWNVQSYNTYLVFFGFWCIVIGYLIFRSTFLPRILGVGMALAGLGYTPYLYPPLANYLFPYNLVLGVGELTLVLWLLIVGVDAQRWNKQASAGGIPR
jgi:hypothetical protein